MENKLTPLQAWKEIKDYVVDGHSLALETEEKGFSLIETALKALEIIKHIMNSCLFYYIEEKDTWEIVFNGEVLLSGKGKEEYKLLKEMFKL